MHKKNQSGRSLTILAAQAGMAASIQRSGVSQKRQDQKQYFYAAIAVFLAGIAFGAYTWMNASQENSLVTQAPSAAGNSPALTAAALSTNSAVASSKSPDGPGAAAAAVFAGDIRPKDFVKSLSIGAWSPKFVPVASLKFTGKPQLVYCLLYARLDKATELTWQRKGMLKNETIVNPFLRPVIIESKDSLDHLFDWHVESVTNEIKPSSTTRSLTYAAK